MVSRDSRRGNGKGSHRCKPYFVGCDVSSEHPQDHTGITNGWGTFDPKSEWKGWLNAIDAKTGTMKWRWKAPTPLVAGVTVTAGDVVFTGDLNGNFLVFDARDGSKLFTSTPEAPSRAVSSHGNRTASGVAVTPGNSGQGWDLPGSATIIIFGL